jgi:hypothetical protein
VTAPTAQRGGTAIALAWIGILIAFIAATANGTLVSRLHLMDVRLPVLAVGAFVSAPGWIILVLAARGRGAPWGWLGFAAAWGVFAATWLASTAESLLQPLYAGIATAVASLGRTVVEAAPSAVIAPVAEEPAKLLGVWIVLLAARRAGARPTAALGAAIGGLVGLWFGLGEAAHHLGEFVGDLGAFDLSGRFIVDWDLVGRVAELQLVTKLFLAGLTNHALFSALAGAGLALLFQGRLGVAIGCFVAALAAHALQNSVGVTLGEGLLDGLLAGPGPLGPGDIPLMLAGWLAAFGAFLVAEGWAAVLVVYFLRLEERRPVRSVAVGA